MKVNTLEKIFSTPRLQVYLQTQPANPEKILGLYQQNIILSRSFYPLLSILEVALRNAIDRECISHFNDVNWLQNQKVGFMIAPAITNNFLRRNVEEAERKLQRRGKTITHGHLVAELTFGFWTEFFERTHYRLLKGIPIRVFPNLLKRIKRVNIYNVLNDIRTFRNRVYHNEPVCFNNGSFDISRAYQIRNSIMDLLSWLSPDIPPWIIRFDDSRYELSLTEYYSRKNNSVMLNLERIIIKLKQSLHLFKR